MTEKKIQMMIDSYRKTVCALCPHRTLCNSLPDDVSCKTVWKLAAIGQDDEEEEGEEDD